MKPSSRFLLPAASLCAAIAIVCVVTPLQAQVTRSFTEPIKRSQVAASEQGVIAAIGVKEGQEVRAGDLLGHLDHDALQQTLRISQLRAKSNSEVRKADSTLRVRKARRDTLQPMLQSGHANQSEVEEAIVAYEVAKSDSELAYEKNAEYTLEVDRIKAQIRAREIYSPINGVISELHYELGEYMSNAKPQFATVAQLDQLLVRFYLLESDAVELKANQEVPLQLRVGKQFQTVNGRVRFVSPVTDPDSGTARVDVVIDNQDRRYRSGSPCHWPTSTEDNVVFHRKGFQRSLPNQMPNALPNSLRSESAF